MYSVLSTLLGIAAALSAIAIFANQFVLRAQPFWASLGWTVLGGGTFFLSSVWLDRLDAKRSGRTPTKILPTAMRALQFLLLAYTLLAIGSWFAIVFFVGFQLPAGDQWDAAAARLAFCLGVFFFSICWYSLTVTIAYRVFENRVDDDWLQSLGNKPTAQQVQKDVAAEFPNGLVVAIGIACVAVLMDVHQLAVPILAKNAFGRRARKLNRMLLLALSYPNTVDLFAAFIGLTCIVTLLCRLHHRLSSPPDDNGRQSME
ncbi:hypothetical protein NZK35_28780 [Stieleria sp. ICT_E10.1]|uniref:hypothetical protein n=1 Tax=Stieleria sedimenti TaxID=2976331 RepID=UPI0021805CB5|nr:hypothetical protein [Stieleria sedimenti]MCS7470666.1 hypothetical protein [Stieleria sedimenti]